MKIGVVSDTHGWIHPRLFEYFYSCDEIWHAGDIGSIETADSFAAFKPFRAVYGNIDDTKVRSCYKKSLIIKIEDAEILMTHIGGTPGHYNPGVRSKLQDNTPDIFICGHSHIAKVIYDKQGGFLFINPGAAGYIGFHKYMTAISFHIDGKKIHNMELIELGERGKATI